jgi:hypothetical protein
MIGIELEGILKLSPSQIELSLIEPLQAGLIVLLRLLLQALDALLLTLAHTEVDAAADAEGQKDEECGAPQEHVA